MVAAQPVRIGRAIGTSMTREVLASDAHRDAVVHLAQAASTGPPWLAIVLAIIALCGTAIVAVGPAISERAKRHKTSTPAIAATPAAEGSVDLVREAMDDIRGEREQAQEEARQLSQQLTAARREVADRDVEIAKRDLRIQHLELQVQNLISQLGRGSA